MKIPLSTIMLVFVLLLSFVTAGEIREIELKDGSKITGEVVSLSNGIYTIKSDALGTIKLEESKVRSMRSKSTASGTATGSTKTTVEDIKALQAKMLNDNDIMDMIDSLKDDPDFKKLLEDPAVLKAVQSGDVAALSANPRFLKLLTHPTVQDIEKKLDK